RNRERARKKFSKALVEYARIEWSARRLVLAGASHLVDVSRKYCERRLAVDAVSTDYRVPDPARDHVICKRGASGLGAQLLVAARIKQVGLVSGLEVAVGEREHETVLAADESAVPVRADGKRVEVVEIAGVDAHPRLLAVTVAA